MAETTFGFHSSSAETVSTIRKIPFWSWWMLPRSCHSVIHYIDFIHISCSVQINAKAPIHLSLANSDTVCTFPDTIYLYHLTNSKPRLKQNLYTATSQRVVQNVMKFLFDFLEKIPELTVVQTVMSKGVRC